MREFVGAERRGREERESFLQVKVVDFKLGEEDRQEEDLAVVDVALEEEERGTDRKDLARDVDRRDSR